MGFHPDVVVFDVNETLSDMAPLADRFDEVGAPRSLMRTWFASLLRDGFALTAAGVNPRFAEVGEQVLRGLLHHEALDRDPDSAARHVMDGFGALSLHDDVVEGMDRLRDAGVRMVTLTNGGTGLSEQMFRRAGIHGHFEQLLSVEDAAAWKPDRRAYEYVAQQCGTPLDAMLLVAVHPWDVDGAKRAGMRAAWLDHGGATYPRHFTEPDIVGRTLGEVAVAAVGSPS